MIGKTRSQPHPRAANLNLISLPWSTMKQKRVVGSFVVSFFFLLAGSANAQSVFGTPTPTPAPVPSPRPSPAATPAPCPTISIQRQAGRQVRDGDSISFTVNIVGGDPKVVPMIIWSTPGGVITQGQNTRRIVVDTTGAGRAPERDVRAEVWVGGYAPECLLQASTSVTVIPPAAKLVEFGAVDDETLKNHLSSISNYMSQSPDSLLVIGYAGRNSVRGFTLNWLRSTRQSLLTAGVPPRRLGFTDGGFREEPFFEFWIVPRGAEPPKPTPTLKPSDIVYPKTPPRKKP
jgi:hypothetical protein